MSFYFELTTELPFPKQAILDDLAHLGVACIDDAPDALVFYRPMQSVRGVCVYEIDSGIEIGLNAWTTQEDAVLAREILATTARILGCPIQPEDSETPITADDVPAYCDDGWCADRHQEAVSVMRRIAEEPQDQPMVVAGYRRAYAFSYGLFRAMTGGGFSEDQAIAKLMHDAIALQEIDQTEDIYVASLLSIPAPKQPETKGWFKRAAPPAKDEKFEGFALAPGVRTLTPTFTSQDDKYAIMGNEEYGYRRVPMHMVSAYARHIGAREFGVGVFDITVNGEPYNDLFYQGEAI